MLFILFAKKRIEPAVDVPSKEPLPVRLGTALKRFSYPLSKNVLDSLPKRVTAARVPRPKTGSF